MSPPLDWGAGRYERVAAQLAPAAAAVVEAAAPRPGERALDIGCGTGTAGLAAARLGARVTGVDPSQRLLEVAREEARAQGLEAAFAAGSAEALPLADASADVVLSAFGVIFAGDPGMAVREIARVATPAARVVFSAWLPEGPLAAVMGARARALAAEARAPAPPFAWHSPEAVGGLFAPFGFSVQAQSRKLAFSDSSPGAFIDGELRDHPAWLAAAAALEPTGGLEALREQALAILGDANEQAGGFRVTSGYAILTLSRSPDAASA